MSEQQRGCGFRRIGGLYLCSDMGEQLACDGLPLIIEMCLCCGYKPPQTRAVQPVSPYYITELSMRSHSRKYEGEESSCSCTKECPVCHADMAKPMGLMYVGGSFYTPASFIKEARELGVSKRIPEIPSWIKLGETWILLAYKEVPLVNGQGTYEVNSLSTKEPETKPAIFYGFKPQRIEMPVWKGTLTDKEILTLEKHGVTPVLLDPTPENRERHKDAKFPFRKMIEDWRRMDQAEELRKKKAAVKALKHIKSRKKAKDLGEED